MTSHTTIEWVQAVAAARGMTAKYRRDLSTAFFTVSDDQHKPVILYVPCNGESDEVSE